MKKLKLVLVLLVILWISIIGSIFYSTSKQTKMINLIGKTKQEVKEYASEYKLNLKFENDYSNNIDKNLVMRQNILVNTVLSEGDTLVITLSLGPISKKAYKEYKVNELGKVPIMMYHGISNIDNEKTAYKNGNVTKDGYERTKESFIKDLDFYYNNNYRMIPLKDYVGGKINVELGKSPIILTFDGNNKNDFKIKGLDNNGNIIIDPNSALGVLEDFKLKYPDYNVTATFFLNKEFLEQPYSGKIINWLIDNNYDIGNNTYNHYDLTELNCFQTSMEVGKMYDEISKITSNYVKIVSLPYGVPNEIEHNNFRCILNSQYKNKHYRTMATLKKDGGYNYSPFDNEYRSEILNRIKAYDSKENKDINYYFKLLENNRYISDGDYKTIVIKKEDQEYLNNQYDLDVVMY